MLSHFSHLQKWSDGYHTLFSLNPFLLSGAIILGLYHFDDRILWRSQKEYSPNISNTINTTFKYILKMIIWDQIISKCLTVTRRHFLKNLQACMVNKKFLKYECMSNQADRNALFVKTNECIGIELYPVFTYANSHI